MNQKKPMPTHASPAALAGVRHLIDGIDDGLLALVAARRHLVSHAAHIKKNAGIAARDSAREREVLLRARRLGNRLGMAPASSDRLMTAIIQDACRQQGIAGHQEGPISQHQDPLIEKSMNDAGDTTTFSRWWQLLPPPSRLAPFLKRIPKTWQATVLEASMRRVLAAPIDKGALDLLAGRKLGIEVSDLGLRWVVMLRDGRMHVCPHEDIAEATVRGNATDLLLLASRREDADTLFFQRRLMLTGDTELGLTARNILDQLPWQEIPLGLRIALHRGADFASTARDAYRGKHGDQTA